jgi:hypothetical protein
MNIDASFFPSGVGAAATIIRNSKGEAIVGEEWPLTNILDATTAEVLVVNRVCYS